MTKRIGLLKEQYSIKCDARELAERADTAGASISTMVSNLQTAVIDSHARPRSNAVIEVGTLCSCLTDVLAQEVANHRRAVASSVELTSGSVEHAFGASRVDVERIAGEFKVSTTPPVAPP